jgi:hypothetical protein
LEKFERLKANLILNQIRDELLHSDLWVNLDSLPNRPRTWAGTSRIQLRTNQKIPGRHYHDVQETQDLPAWRTLTHTRNFVIDFAREVTGEIGHVRAASLRGGAEIIPHVDIGEYCAVRNRYHLVIVSKNGTEFIAGDERVTMNENELWWFDNKSLHSVRNPGDVPRIHLVFDILPCQSVPFCGS